MAVRSRLVADTAIYDGQGLLHADIDVTSGGFEGTPGAGSEFDCVGYQGQSGAYTDLETVHTASGLYTALTAPGGLTTYYDPLKGLGFSRRQEAVLNAYAQNINPFAGWTFGAYASEVKQFGVGEIKGAVNYVADRATLGLVTDPLAAHGQNEQAGAETLPVIADTVQWVDGVGEVVVLARFVRGGAAKIVAGAGSRLARKGNCFVAGTPVQMADGSTKPIEQVKVGDYVKSRNPQTGQTEAKRVTETFSHLAPQVLTLSLTDPQTGHAAEQITCTPGHPFYVEGRGFVLAGQLGIGTSIVTRAGPSLTLSATSWSAAPASGNGLMLDGTNDGSNTATPGTRVYNFTVDGDHTYFVGTVGGGTWVHNDSLNLSAAAKEIHALSTNPYNETIAIAEVELDGVTHRVITTNMGYLNGAQRTAAIQKGYTYLGDLPFTREHAEDILFRLGEKKGFNFNGKRIGVSHNRGICIDCQPQVESRGMRLSGTRFSGQKFPR